MSDPKVLSYILLYMVFVQTCLAFYCWFQWHKWMNAFQMRWAPKDPEMSKETQYMPMFQAPDERMIHDQGWYK